MGARQPYRCETQSSSGTSPNPYPDRLIVRIVADPAAAAIAFETGTVDLGYRTPVPLADLARLKTVPSLRFETKERSYSYNVTRLEFNPGRSTLQERRCARRWHTRWIATSS